MMTPDWDSATRILCVRLDSLGDVLMCTPAMRAVRDALPGRAITLLTSTAGARASPFIPEVDAVLAYQAPWMKSSDMRAPASDIGFAQQLSEAGFDAAIIFTSYSQSPLPAAMLCYLAGIPLRLAHCHENPYQLLTDWLPDPEPDRVIRHEVRRQLDLVARIGCEARSTRMSFRLRDEDIAAVRERLAGLGIGENERWLLMHPGASAPSRRYPPRHWADAIRRVSHELGIQIVLTGGADEVKLVDDIRESCGVAVHSLAGQLSLGELGAALKLATAVVANNTGPAHIAAAVGTPLVDLYAMTNPQHTPWQVRNRLLYHDVPCRFCMKSVCPQGHNDCLTKIAPQRVVEALQSLLAP